MVVVVAAAAAAAGRRWCCSSWGRWWRWGCCGALAWVITCIVSYPWKPPKLRAVAIMHHIAPVTVRNEKRVATPKSPVSFKDTQVGLGCDTSLLKADLPSKNAALQ